MFAMVIKSETSGKVYEVKQGHDGVLYCSCPAWKFQHAPASQRSCKHMKQAKALLDSK